MADDPNKTGKQDDSRINLHQAHEVAYWTKKLGVSEQKLKEAVGKVGSMVKDVKKHLGVSE
jgi:hypothetical protein